MKRTQLQALERPELPPSPEGLPMREGRTPRGLEAPSQVGRTSLCSCGVFAYRGGDALLCCPCYLAGNIRFGLSYKWFPRKPGLYLKGHTPLPSFSGVPTSTGNTLPDSHAAVFSGPCSAGKTKVVRNNVLRAVVRCWRCAFSSLPWFISSAILYIK